MKCAWWCGGHAVWKNECCSSVRELSSGSAGTFPWEEGFLANQSSFCHHHLLELLLISHLIGEREHEAGCRTTWVR